MALNIKSIPNLFGTSKDSPIIKKEAGSAIITGNAFMPNNANFASVTLRGFDCLVVDNTALTALNAPIQIPDGAVISSAIVTGNVSNGGTVWNLLKVNRNTAAGASINTAVINTSAKADEIVDNSTFYYYFSVEVAITNADRIFAAQVNYTFSKAGSASATGISGGKGGAPG